MILAEQSGEQSKKLKVDAGAGTKSSESGPYVVISEALANFFGTSGREMLQSEVLRRVWEYINVNHLEVSRYLSILLNMLTCVNLSGSNVVYLLVVQARAARQ